MSNSKQKKTLQTHIDTRMQNYDVLASLTKQY
jgi:hypothetical protein